MKKIGISRIIRWSARIIGTSILAFILFFLLTYLFNNTEVDEGFRSTSELIAFLLFPISTTIGLAIALKWDGFGGLISVLGIIGLFILQPNTISPIFLFLLLPGLLYLTYWGMSKRMQG